MSEPNDAVPLLTVGQAYIAADTLCAAVPNAETTSGTYAALKAIADGRAVTVSAAELAAKDQQIADLTKAAECSAAAHAGMVAVADALRGESAVKNAEIESMSRSIVSLNEEANSLRSCLQMAYEGLSEFHQTGDVPDALREIESVLGTDKERQS